MIKSRFKANLQYKIRGSNQYILFDNNIKNKTIKLLAEDKSFLGLYSYTEAFDLAKEQKLNLIQISEYAEKTGDKISICIIYDIKKYLYEKNKQSKKAKKPANKEVLIKSKTDLTDMVRKLDEIVKGIDTGADQSVTLTLKRTRMPFDNHAHFISHYFNNHATCACNTTFRSEREIKFYIHKKKA